MDEFRNSPQKLRIEKLVPFSLCSGQTYSGDRLEQLKVSIRNNGLINPIIVRPHGDGIYEIICGHNRVNAVKEIGQETILGEVRDGLSDTEALRLYYDSNLNQQTFSDWNYTQKFKAIYYIEELIRQNSQQGKRNDLKKTDSDLPDETSVQTRQKLRSGTKQTTRDKMARTYGISTSNLSKYRRIIKLPNETVDTIARLLDEKKLSFEAAFLLSGMKEESVNYFVDYVDQQPIGKIDLSVLREECRRNRPKKNPNLYDPIRSKQEHQSILRSALHHKFSVPIIHRPSAEND